ncbi:MAG: sugar-binding domain-containing protein [Phycisphaerae bacterium]
MRHAILNTSIVTGLFTMTALAADIPWPEHPRPDFQRSPWVNLNGPWSFDFDPQDAGEKEQWFAPGKHAFSKQITVPFPWESKLSGIGDKEYNGVAWYSREIALPDGEGWKGKDVWLIVGACDWEAKVWVNGKPAVEHVGGYLPFEVNLSQFAKPGEKVMVVIRAKDITDDQQPTGKQIGWYTRTSGIWQTVYLEARGSSYFRTMRYVPDIKNGSMAFEMSGQARGSVALRVSSPANAFGAAEIRVSPSVDAFRSTVKVKIREPKLWSPESPMLYPVVFELQDDRGIADRVESYFGLREISAGKAPGRDYQYVYLNGKPIYLAGALHQSFHPEGIYQYPSDAVMRSDYELCKKIGINFLRIHIKIPIPRELYWADKLGVMIMQDMPNFWNNTGQARKWYEEMLHGAVARDFNHPAIFAWVDFNETWGLNHPGPYDAERQEWVEQIYKLTKGLDPTRLVEDNSPCNYDHVVTDINSWHFYINDYEQAKKHLQKVVDKTYPGSTFNYIGDRKQDDAPLMNSEYGGIGAGSGDQDISWCFKYLTNELRKHDKICGYIYTELSDIEWEHNGYVNYDRSPKEYGYDFWFPGFSLADINSPDFVVIDAPPMVELKDGQPREIPIKISHWSEKQAKALTLRWRADWIDRDGVKWQGEKWETQPAAWKPYQVVDQPAIKISAAPGAGSAVGALLVELVDDNVVLARNYINLLVRRSSPAVEVVGKACFLRFRPGDFSAWQWEESQTTIPAAVNADKVCIRGSGYVEYQIDTGIKSPDGLVGLDLTAEVAAKAGDEKLDWPQRKKDIDYPQTDVKKWPSDLRISINGVEIHRATLPDDPADARGALSHHGQYHPGSYGFLITANVQDESKVKRLFDASKDGILTIRFEVPVDAKNKGGLAIFGDTLGCYPVMPTLVVYSRNEMPQPPASFTARSTAAVNRFTDRSKSLLPTAEAGAHAWRWTTDKPGDGWNQPDFDDRQWKTGKSGFGRDGTPDTIIGTSWTSPDIWLRTEVTVEDPAAIVAGQWRLYHDEDCEVFINGKQVIRQRGFVTQYKDVPLGPGALSALRPGRNIIAVHCHQTSGGQYIDIGLTVMVK